MDSSMVRKRPPTRTVWFESPPQPLKIASRERCHEERVANLLVRERRRRSQTLPYALRFEGVAHTRHDVGPLQLEAMKLAGSLERMWPYAAGVLFNPLITQTTLAWAPDGWRTNSQRLKHELPANH